MHKFTLHTHICHSRVTVLLQYTRAHAPHPLHIHTSSPMHVHCHYCGVATDHCYWSSGLRLGQEEGSRESKKETIPALCASSFTVWGSGSFSSEMRKDATPPSDTTNVHVHGARRCPEERPPGWFSISQTKLRGLRRYGNMSRCKKLNWYGESLINS
jgi:hypothetical protein